MMRISILISLVAVLANANEIAYELGSTCNNTIKYNLDDAYIIDKSLDENFINTCNVTIDATNKLLDGFILRIDFNKTVKHDSFSMNISDLDVSKTKSSNSSINLICLNSTINSSRLYVVLSNYFHISFNNSSNLNLIEAIIFTSFNYSKNSACSKNEIQCKLFDKACINNLYVDSMFVTNPCIDDSSPSPLPSSSTKTIIASTTLPKTSSNDNHVVNASTTPLSKTSSIKLVVNTTTIINSTDDFHIIKKKSFNIVALIAFILVVFSACVIGIVIYGRRQRKWREFLAQLDNNTDWEYEQLEDMPIGSNDRYMSTVFDRTISTSESDRETSNRINQTTRLNNEQTPIANLNN